jgi:peptidyl-prolyl cis-trans isomerase A (cyclophilin A)
MKTTFGLLAILATGAFAQAPPAAAPAAPARDPGLYATINTTMGAITVKFYEKEAPITVKNFVALAKGTKQWKDPSGKMVTRPLYNGTIFHRVIPNFMIQGGDPTGTGSGDPGFVIPDEFSPDLKFDVVGRLAMANAGPHTGNSQFFITDVPTPHLNGRHTIFGQVVDGQDVVHKIINVPTVGQNKPVTPVKIVSIVVKREGSAPASAAPKKAAAKKT